MSPDEILTDIVIQLGTAIAIPPSDRTTMQLLPQLKIDSLDGKSLWLPKTQRLMYLAIHSFGDNPYNAALALVGTEL